jgi:hypothetical protein
MKVVRILLTFFMLVLVALSALGWVWTSRHQTPAQSAASHVVLGVSAALGVIVLVWLWTADHRSRLDVLAGARAGRSDERP